MIPGEADRVVTCLTTSQPWFALLASFKAPHDLVLRRAVLTGLGCQIISRDPLLTTLEPSGVYTDFQLIKFDPNSRIEFMDFDDLSFPLLKDQFLYWGSDGVSAQLSCQLFFSAETLS